MILRCGLRRYNRVKRLKEWHRKFAWFPVEVGEFDCRWLEMVERKGTRFLEWNPYLTRVYRWTWEYRSL